MFKTYAKKIYMYMCVCVCVCVCIERRRELERQECGEEGKKRVKKEGRKGGREKEEEV